MITVHTIEVLIKITIVERNSIPTKLLLMITIYITIHSKKTVHIHTQLVNDLISYVIIN